MHGVEHQGVSRSGLHGAVVMAGGQPEAGRQAGTKLASSVALHCPDHGLGIPLPVTSQPQACPCRTSPVWSCRWQLVQVQVATAASLTARVEGAAQEVTLAGGQRQRAQEGDQNQGGAHDGRDDQPAGRFPVVGGCE